MHTERTVEPKQHSGGNHINLTQGDLQLIETRYNLLLGRTSASLIFRSLGHRYVWSRQEGRTCHKHVMTNFMSNVKTKNISATPAIDIRHLLDEHLAMNSMPINLKSLWTHQLFHRDTKKNKDFS